ncbi:MAG: sugar-binding protein, partial [Candidatus Paceibacterota bacterium]
MNRIRINSIITGLIILFLIPGCEKHKPEAKSVIYLPRIDNIVIDGFTEEWAKAEGFRLWADPLGNYKEPSDFEAVIKAAWNEEGLLLQFEVTDDSFKSDTLNPWNGDAIEIFLAPFRGSEEIFQISIVPLPEKDFIRLN